MQHQTLAPTPIPNRPFVAGLRDGLLLALLARTTGRKLRGRLLVRLPSGKARTIGSGHNLAQVHFLTFSAITACMRRGPLGFAEAYLDGAIEVSDLGAVFRFFIDNRAQLAAAGRGAFKARAFDRMGHAERANTRSGSKRNIEEHYDLGNAFYALWLDASMSYSSALFVEPGMSLEDGQAAKYEAILDALDLQPGHDVLEIGCGWGAFAQAALEAGAHVNAITISQRQYDYTRDRVTQALKATVARDDGSVAIKLQDYRDTEGQFDRVASIEMIEAVGEENWDTYFKVLHDRLKPGGTAAVQAITIRPSSFAHYRQSPDFIQRYIFPGGMLPTADHMAEAARAAGLVPSGQLLFGQSYAETLRIWRARFDQNWPQIAALGFSERFAKLWRYYLIYCEAGFERGVIDVGVYTYRRPD